MKILTDKFNSDIFNMKMGNIVELEREVTEVEVLHNIESAKKEGYKHLNVKVPTIDKITTNSFLKNGFNLVDTQLMYCINAKIVRKRTHTDAILYREYQESDKFCIMNIARTAYILDQYHSDAVLDDTLCDNYYAEWLKNCCNGFSDKIMVAVLPDNQVIGYLTLNFKKDNAVVGLVAVDERYRRKGYFSFLIENTLSMLKTENISSLYYGTQLSNSPVLKTMARFHGVLKYSNHVMHLKI